MTNHRMTNLTRNYKNENKNQVQFLASLAKININVKIQIAGESMEP